MIIMSMFMLFHFLMEIMFQKTLLNIGMNFDFYVALNSKYVNVFLNWL